MAPLSKFSGELSRVSRVKCETPKPLKVALTPSRMALTKKKSTPNQVLELRHLKLKPFRENFYQQTVRNRTIYDPMKLPQLKKKVRVDLELPEISALIAKPWSIESSLDL